MVERVGSPLNESTGHHVAQTSSGSRDDADLAVHGQRSKRTLGVLSVTSTNNIMSWVVLAPFLQISSVPLDSQDTAPRTVGAWKVKLSSTLAIFGSTSTRCFS